MNPKVMLIAFIGVGLFGMYLFVRSMKPAALPPYPSFVNVYVVKRDLKVGKWLDPRTDLTWKKVKWENHTTNNVLTTQNINGDVLRSSIPAGSFLFKRDLVAPGDSDFLTYAIHPGKVAVSLAIPIQNAVDHFIQPGEHDDVLMRNDGQRVAKVVLT
ncbi:MAG: Flp pilus assembly protein CpaB, partial [Acetobacter sp.]|nr:Flp pilus assembly protein CpaB [Acetobacter sp.]